ncbi:MAG: oligosaccharide flippase family protein [Gaiellaceae bacterium MAG52_C11]|nr:oligosaccharide flippase family protein [Candidatus Gaiellasilicea maunaloa]
MSSGRQRATSGAVRPAPAIDGTPPVSPDQLREVPGERQVGRNTLETLLFRGLSTPIALVLVVVQSRFLAPSGRGTFVLVVLTVTILSRLLGQLGLAVTTRLREGDVEVRQLVHRAFALAAALGLVGGALVVVSGALTDAVGAELALIAAVALIPNVLWQTVSGVLLGQARVRLWNYVQALSPLLTLAGMLVLVVGLGGGVRAAVAAWAVAHVLTATFALVAARDLWLPVGPPAFRDEHGRTILRLALVLGAVQVVNLIGYRIELFILEWYDGVAAVGVYSIAMQAAEALWLIPAAIATAITGPAVHDDERDATGLVGRSALKGLAYTAGVAVAVGIAAPFLIPLLFGGDFDGAARPLALLLPGIVAYAPVTVLVVYLSLRHGRPNLSLGVSVVAMVVTAALALLLIPRYGAEGAAGASALGYAAGAALAWIFFRRLSRQAARGWKHGTAG